MVCGRVWLSQVVLLQMWKHKTERYHAHTHTHIHMYMHPHSYICTHTHVHVCTHTYTYTIHVHAPTLIHTHTHDCIDTHTLIQCMYMHPHSWIHRHMHTQCLCQMLTKRYIGLTSRHRSTTTQSSASSSLDAIMKNVRYGITSLWERHDVMN